MNGERKNNTLAIVSLVLGILSFVCLGILSAIPAIITGHIAHGRARKAPDRYEGAGMAVAGFVLGYLNLLLTAALVALMIPAIHKGVDSAKAAATRNLVRSLNQGCQAYELDFAAFPPSGNASLVKALSGAGGKRMAFYEFSPDMINERREVVDAWRRPLVYVNNADGTAPKGWVPRNARSFDLYSWGPNGIDEKGLGDDLRSGD